MRKTLTSIGKLAITLVAVAAVSMGGLALAQTATDQPGQDTSRVQQDTAGERPRPGPAKHRVRPGAVLEDLASFLGIDRADLVERLQGGETLAGIAESAGVSRDALVDHLLGRLADRLDEAVANGRIDAERRDAIVERAAERIGRRVDTPVPDREERKQRAEERRRRHERRVRGGEALAEALGMTVDELRAELQDGATVAELAERQGVAIGDLVDALVEQAADRLDEAVEAGRIDADRAAERLAELRRRIEERLGR